MGIRVHALIIDPQKDFCDPNGSLYVKGADDDMDRLALFVEKAIDKLADIHVTLDSHRNVDISHPMWWRDSGGNSPAPFTVITQEDVEKGRWTTTQPSAYKRSLAYINALAATGRYPHVIWPEHCRIGSEGHGVWGKLLDATHAWERKRYAMVDFVTKGSNPWTEHFSAVKAEVPDPDDPSTQVNTRLIKTLEEADVVLLAGEALSHCMANSVRDVASEFGDPAYVKKLVLLTDASSPVTSFEKFGTDFVDEMVKKGMRTATTSDALATL